MGIAVVALLGFGVFVLTNGGPRPALAPLSQADQPGAPEGESEPVPPANQATPSATTPAATARFDAWAQPLRSAGLTLTADSITERGETLSVAGLTVAGPDQLPGWRWTVQNASLYDQEPFHLQAAGETTLTLKSGPDVEISWSGRVDAFGIALQRDVRDVLSRSVIFRVNGLSLQGPGDSSPLTLADGQLRILLVGGTGLLPQGTKFTLRLTDMAVPAAVDSALGSKVKSFTTEFALPDKLMGYSLPEMLGLFGSGANGAIGLRTVALDWGTLHFIGEGDVGVSRTGVLNGRLDVKITDIVPFFDAVAAAGAADADALADAYAAVLLEMGSNPTATALPFTIAINAGAVALEGASRGLADIVLGLMPPIIIGDLQGADAATAPASPLSSRTAAARGQDHVETGWGEAYIVCARP